jgi:hypothetical protein
MYDGVVGEEWGRSGGIRNNYEGLAGPIDPATDTENCLSDQSYRSYSRSTIFSRSTIGDFPNEIILKG